MRRLFVVLAVMVGIAVASGCVVDRTHNRRHWESFKKDLHGMHQTIDRHVFNFDEDDPDRY